MKKLGLLALCTFALMTAAPASAQFARPDQAIKYRQSAMTLQAAHLGRIGAMVNGRVPFDAKVVADNVAVLEVVTKLPWSAFGPDTGTGNTKAKPEIWKEPAKFKEASEKLMAEVAKLGAAAKTGSLDAVKAAFGPVAASCKACHDSFQQQ